MPRLENVSLEELHEALAEIEGSRATQRVMVAINYKHEDGVTQKEIAKRYNIASRTVGDWIERVERIRDGSPNGVLSDTSQSRSQAESENQSKESDSSPENDKILSPAITLTREQKEQRRLAAAKELLEGEMSQTAIAKKHGVTPAAVSKWKSRWKRKELRG